MHNKATRYKNSQHLHNWGVYLEAEKDIGVFRTLLTCLEKLWHKFKVPLGAFLIFSQQ